MDLADELRRYLAGEPVRAKAVSTTEWVVKWARRRPAIASLAATLVACVVIGFASVFVLWRSAESGRATAEEERTKAVSARNAAEQARATSDLARAAAERSLYFHRIAQAHAEWQQYRIDRAEQLLDECPPSMRDWEWSYLKNLCRTDLRTMRGHSHLVSCVAYSPDGKLVASGTGQWANGRSGEIIIWDAATGEVRATLRGQDGHIANVSFSPDGQRLVTSSARWDNPNPASVVIWSISGEKLHTFLSGNGAWDAAFTPDGRQLVTSSPDVRLWDAETGDLLHVFAGHKGSIFDISISPDGTLAASVGRDGSARVWNLVRREAEFALTGYGDLRRVSFSPDGRFLALIGSSDALWIVDVAKPTGKPQLYHLFNHRNVALAYSPEGRRLALAGVDGSVRIIDLADGIETGRELKAIHTHDGAATALAFSPDGRNLATGGVDRTVKIFDAQTDDTIDHLDPRVLGNYYRLLFTPDGSRMLVPTGYNRGSPGRGERALVAWDIERSARAHTMKHSGWLADVSLSADGSRVATASEDKTARIWSMTNGAELLRLQHPAAVLGVALNPANGSVTTACADATLRTWNSETGELMRESLGHDGKVTAVRHSPDGRWLASAGADGTVRLWSGDTGEARHVLRGHAGEINSLAFSHDAELLASAGADATVRLWDVAAGDVVHVLRGHHDVVNDLCFSTNNRRVASTSNDSTIKLWDVESGEEALTLRPESNVLGLAFSPDGKRLVTSLGAVLRFWNTELQPPSAPLARAFDAANRDWHDRQAWLCDKDKQHVAAAFHLSRLTDLASTRAALDASPQVDDILSLATIQIARGNVDEYRASCRRILDQVTDSSPSPDINTAVWCCVLVPNAIADTDRLVSLSKRAIAAATDAKQRATLANTHAAAFYRAGRLDEARSWLQKSIDYDGAGGVVEDWLFLAMVEQQRGRPAEAREWLRKSEAWLANPPAHHANGSPVAGRWSLQVAWSLLLSEAESLIQ
jgi:WD40 repeat protein